MKSRKCIRGGYYGITVSIMLSIVSMSALLVSVLLSVLCQCCVNVMLVIVLSSCQCHNTISAHTSVHVNIIIILILLLPGYPMLLHALMPSQSAVIYLSVQKIRTWIWIDLCLRKAAMDNHRTYRQVFCT